MTIYDREALEMAAEIAKSNVGQDIEGIGELVDHIADTPATGGVYLAPKIGIVNEEGDHLGHILLGEDDEWVFELPSKKSSDRPSRDDEDASRSRSRRDDSDEDERPRRRK